ncbi:MAG: SDR family oxidoreductase [Deltaproteobacteria bacterium]|nr:MAG: SDR family oxidoreductase [Deltaproteobacteria bacterium]
MDLGIAGKAALVTASSRGLGFEAAKSLAEEGAKVAICARHKKGIEEARDQLKQSGADILALTCDVTDESEVERMVRTVNEKFGAIDILVANCGGPPPGPFLQHTAEDWRKAVELNLMSTVFLCRQVIPGMTERRWGRIVLMTSITAKQPIEGLVLSNSVRAAVVGLGKSLAGELGPYNILVNSVCPGYFLTERVRGLAESSSCLSGESPQAFIDSWAQQGVLGRIGNPAEFGPLVAFLCSEKASYITGAAVAIDGGLNRSIF